jgi:hypothetical protein
MCKVCSYVGQCDHDKIVKCAFTIFIKPMDDHRRHALQESSVHTKR